ncbi:MAG: hypothetical protein QOC61_165 [Acidobacteriota bacterium]|jgi:hypothetical protein|nr:hypothetical protein [Acidobacteriota bacterium]MDT5261161.1 hypothetical protein [Acidobacteriota bacterium]MDT7779487.1 hypothetical protein [Acidobacteriota bacterium]
MSEEKNEEMREEVQPKPSGSTSSIRRVGIYSAVLLVGLLLGFVPMWVKARACASSLAETEQHLSLARMQNTLSSAVIDARRGDYEPARQSASQFFTTLRAEADRENSSLTKAQRDGVQTLFAGRDEIITLLARSDPASADRLSDLYVEYRKLMIQG